MYIYYISFTRASCIRVLKSLLNYEIGRVSTRDHFLWSRRVFRHFKIAEIEKNCRSASVKQDELTWQLMKSIYIFDITKILESLAIMFIIMAVIVRFSTSYLTGSLAHILLVNMYRYYVAWDRNCAVSNITRVNNSCEDFPFEMQAWRSAFRITIKEHFLFVITSIYMYTICQLFVAMKQ